MESDFFSRELHHSENLKLAEKVHRKVVFDDSTFEIHT
ncbi:hypothetical protein LEP1GSC203_0341 [Leptospira terpstrae serovar Hualin str. LT 11-33 = ATCC 700639]|uniref:Uncharacterized protein n=1 Tax=Leptospira terpstrae serovar Hualin str. LT 11-33 = ATCC 700639 TaxID=1257025 RepID=N1VUJ8_9LEPT|nr:hypothetical protein LEP1GSC203_0341 [Leptospira terpstrae serovar Hualin str. LT 11-33 = ATCC 700639]